MIRGGMLIGILAVLATGCERSGPLQLAGSTDWDRGVVLAEASEPVLEWYVAEGDRVLEGDLLLRLDTARYDARIEAAKARSAEAQAQLAELESRGVLVDTAALERFGADLAIEISRSAG